MAVGDLAAHKPEAQAKDAPTLRLRFRLVCGRFVHADIARGGATANSSGPEFARTPPGPGSAAGLGVLGSARREGPGPRRAACAESAADCGRSAAGALETAGSRASPSPGPFG